MRSLLGLAMLVAVGLGGLEVATQNMPLLARGSDQQMQAALVEPVVPMAQGVQALPLPPVPAPTFGGVVMTVAANEPSSLPPVTVAPQAPRAAQIAPIVTPLKSAAPKTKSKAAAKAAPESKVAGAPLSGKAKSTVTKTATAKVKSPASNAAKSKAAAKQPDPATRVTVTRPGFKLTCTTVQKLDPVKQRCVPLKTASTKKTKS